MNETGFVAIIAIIAIIVSVVVICVHHFVSRKWRARKLAQKILDDLRRVYVEKHELRLVDASDFSDVNLGYYQQATAILESKDFSALGDIEDLTVSNVYPDLRTFARVFVNTSRTVVASVCDLKLRGAVAKHSSRRRKHAEFTTEFTNGCFLTTSNAKSPMTLPSQIMAVTLPWDTSISTLLKTHEKRMQQYQQHHSGTCIALLSTLEDVLKSAQRALAMKAAYRKSLGGGLLEEEIRGIATYEDDDLYDPTQTADRVFREMRKLLKSEQYVRY